MDDATKLKELKRVLQMLKNFHSSNLGKVLNKMQKGETMDHRDFEDYFSSKVFDDLLDRLKRSQVI